MKEDAKTNREKTFLLRVFLRAFAPSRRMDAINLAVSAGLSVLMGVVLWPWGIVAVGYVTIRLHLSKIIALVCLAVCMLPAVPMVCERVGGVLVKSDGHPHWRWIVGSHLVAIPAALVVGWAVYAVASQFGTQSRAVPARSGAARPGSERDEK